MSKITFWGLTASPFQLKMQALADYSRLSWQRWPDQCGRFQSLRAMVQLGSAKRRARVKRYPHSVSTLDEYPAVPYYSLNNGEFFYDSSALARHLDALGASNQPLVPKAQDLGFICQLIDEAFDEFGLYMVHHNRWVTSAGTNRMGEMTVNELRGAIPNFFRARLARKLAARQVRRLPYLFSIAPCGFDAELTPAITPPSREGFPETHSMLNQAWKMYLAALDHLLAAQPYLLGDRFTLADASAYGQLSMNLVDGRAAELLQELAPRVYKWLCFIRDGDHAQSNGDLYLSEDLNLLLDCIKATFIPLMQQNNRAYLQAVNRGQSLFNETAFDLNQALYDGELLGSEFRSVAKTFQVSTWHELCEKWQDLDTDVQDSLQTLYPQLKGEIFEKA
ncbi:MAG: hypothetical protein HOM95_10890 [Halieaceae bacterium]|nr:hypothetical protein [Halieaceae bacterium]